MFNLWLSTSEAHYHGGTKCIHRSTYYELSSNKTKDILIGIIEGKFVYLLILQTTTSWIDNVKKGEHQNSSNELYKPENKTIDLFNLH